MPNNRIFKNPFTGIPRQIYALRMAVERKRPLPCIKSYARGVVVLVARGRLLETVTLVVAIDELASCHEVLMESPWTENLFLPAPALRAALLSNHLELRAEEGADVRTHLRRGIRYTDRISTSSPSYRAAMGDKALLLTGQAMLDEADQNIHGAVSSSAQAVAAARASMDNDVLRLALYARARILMAIGEFAAANALRMMANGLANSVPSRVWLSPTVWGLDQGEDREALAA